MANVLDGVTEVTESAGVPPASVLGIGVALPGVVDSDAGGTVHAQSLGWSAVPLGALLREATDLPVLLDNGAKTLGQAEMWFGAGRGYRHVVVALVGSGVGAAVISEGASFRGSRSSAGEWGHTTLVHGGRLCRCGARGCLEAYVGAEAVLDRFHQAHRGKPLPGPDEPVGAGTAARPRRVRRAQRPGYSPRRPATWAPASGNLINLFNPERIIIGGWAGLLLGECLPAGDHGGGGRAGTASAVLSGDDRVVSSSAATRSHSARRRCRWRGC